MNDTQAAVSALRAMVLTFVGAGALLAVPVAGLAITVAGFKHMITRKEDMGAALRDIFVAMIYVMGGLAIAGAFSLVASAGLAMLPKP